MGEVFVLVFVQDGQGVFVEENRQAVECLLGGDIEDAVLNIDAADLNDIGITQAGEGAEAEEVLGAAEDRAVAPASFWTLLRLRSLIFYVAGCAYKFIVFAGYVQIDFLGCK